MLFTETKLIGAYIIDLEKKTDHRGFFARMWCKNEFDKHGLNTKLAQSNVALSKLKGTLRGMHYQIEPYQEVKLVRCTKGALTDVIVDLRRDSPTYKQWISLDLTENNHRMIYVPEGFSHGYQTLMDNTELVYHASEFYKPEAARGVRYDDPAFGIQWPIGVEVISDADRSWPPYTL